MAVTFSGVTTVTQNGGGSWQDISGGQGSSSTTISFFSGTSSQGRKFSGVKGMEWNFGTAQDFSDKIVVMRYQLVGGFAGTRASGAGQIVVNGSAGYYVAGSDTYTAGFQVVVADLSTAPSTGSFTNTAVTTIGLQVNASGGSGGDPNFYIDELLLVDTAGIVATGDTTTLISDLIAYDQTNLFGIVDNAAGIAVSKAKLVSAPNATGISSSDEVIAFDDPVYDDGTNVSRAVTNLGYSSADFDVTTLTRATFIGSANPDITGTAGNRSIDLSTSVNDVLDTCTFTGFDAATNAVVLGSNSVSGCSFNSCGSVSVSATVSNCFFRSQAQSSAVTTNNLNLLDGCSFTKDSTPVGHAVELTSVGTGSMNWNCTTNTGYDTGSTGSPVTPTNTGNETIYVNVASGTLTINVADGATIPSIRSAGATVSVVAGQRTFTVAVSDINTGSAVQDARVYVTAAAGGGLAEGTVIIDRALTDVNGEVSDTRSYSSAQPYTGVVRRATSGTLYKATSISGTISAAENTTVNVSLIPDE